MRPACPLALACAAVLLGCGGATESASRGRIVVTVATTGDDPQSPRYLLSLDGANALSVDPNGFAVFEDVAEGTHRIHLFSLSDNCVVSGRSGPRSVRVSDGRVSEVSFLVSCVAPVTGGLRAPRSTTTGTSSPWPAPRSAPSG
jgi:hypothetical protein